MIDYLGEKSIVVDRSWVYWFASQHNQMLAVQRAKYLEKGHSVLRSEPHYPRSASPAQLLHLVTARFMRFRDFQDYL
jgi:hypothetical protein